MKILTNIFIAVLLAGCSSVKYPDGKKVFVDGVKTPVIKLDGT